jgi:threonine dehydratase
MSSVVSRPLIDEIRAAQSRLHGIAIRTPLLKLDYEIPGLEIYLKCEQFQPTSSFKVRGAINVFKTLSPKQKENGVVAASSGNMGKSVAWLARQENIPCRILAPDTINEAKQKEIERLGGKITKCTFNEWFQVILSHQCPILEGHFIHPTTDRNGMAGMGTIALEILDDLPECNAILGRYVPEGI